MVLGDFNPINKHFFITIVIIIAIAILITIVIIIAIVIGIVIIIQIRILNNFPDYQANKSTRKKHRQVHPQKVVLHVRPMLTGTF